MKFFKLRLFPLCLAFGLALITPRGARAVTSMLACLPAAGDTMLMTEDLDSVVELPGGG